MDNLTLFLGVAIVITIIMLNKCKTKSHPATAVSEAKQTEGYTVSNESSVSDFGTGVTNRKADARYDDASNINKYDDYIQAATFMSVEPEVFASHNEYTKNHALLTTGASRMSERDDPNDVNPRVGLRKANYQAVYAGSADSGYRVEHSEIPDQMPTNSSYTIG